MPLTDNTIRDAKPQQKPVKLYDGGGLYLLVAPNGGKWWRLKYRFGGMEKGIALGTFPEVTLEAARQKRDAYRQLLANGTDPAKQRKAERDAEREALARQTAVMRFTMDNAGSLSICLGTRRIRLLPSETAELRAFLEATKNVGPKE
jgi:hypothetical protein